MPPDASQTIATPDLPPLARQQFDIGSTPVSLARLVECAAEHGDLSCVARAARRRRMEYVDDGQPIEVEAAINLRTRTHLRMRLHPRH